MRSTIPTEMAVLWGAFHDGVDLVNGYKISRSDPMHRIVIGRIYHHTVKLLFGLKVRDVDCDFRLLRRSIFDRVHAREEQRRDLSRDDEEDPGCRLPIAEVPVHHYHRAHGQSQFFNFRRLFKTAVDVAKLWYVLVVRGDASQSDAAACACCRFRLLAGTAHDPSSSTLNTSPPQLVRMQDVSRRDPVPPAHSRRRCDGRARRHRPRHPTWLVRART